MLQVNSTPQATRKAVVRLWFIWWFQKAGNWRKRFMLGTILPALSVYSIQASVDWICIVMPRPMPASRINS